MKKTKGKKKSTPLNSQIEVLSDARDPAAAEHLSYFLRNFSNGLNLPVIDLTTPEAAKSSIAIIDEQAKLLEKKLRTIQSLKKLFP